MSSPPRPSHLALLILQCFATVKVCVNFYLVWSCPLNTFELVAVILFFVCDVFLALVVHFNKTELLVFPQLFAVISMIWHFMYLFILFLVRMNNQKFEEMRKEMEKDECYFVTFINTEFAYIAFFVTMFMIHYFQYHLIDSVRMLKDPKYKTFYNEVRVCGRKDLEETAAEIV